MDNDIECKFYHGLNQLYHSHDGSVLLSMIDNTDNVVGEENIGLQICLIIGRSYYHGNGMEKNMEKSIEYYQKAIEKGYDKYDEIIEAYKGLNDEDRLFDYLVELAENQNELGMVELGKLLLTKGDEESKEMAFIWLDGAASLGNKEAQKLVSKHFN